ncbi:MAG TPA: T9SS type A sorting domain-containing protein [Bacteroidia bacterium]|nr:T9SS type A sorting domain-containing protein [Bacteroidia bacterium]
MKTQFKLTILLYCLIGSLQSQDIVNSYIDWNNLNQSSIEYNQPTTQYQMQFNSCYPNTTNPYYNGEYQFYLSCTPWHDFNIIWAGWPSYNTHDFLYTYKTELLSFPFTNDCAFQNGCADNTNIRNLSVPLNSQYSNADKVWNYPNSIGQQNLINISQKKSFFFDNHNVPLSEPAAIVSSSFVRNGTISIDRDVYPHSILKHTVEIHCDQDIQDPILTSFSFIVDLSRGMMREYPFYPTNSTGATMTSYDICFAPMIYNRSTDYSATTNCEYYGFIDPAENCGGYVSNSGGTLNYTPFDVSNDDDCSLFYPAIYPTNITSTSDFYLGQSGGYLNNIPLPPYSLPAFVFPRSQFGETPAGYLLNSGIMQRIVSTSSAPVQQYFINNNINLEYINPIEKVIYNPSEVTITASDLHFPHNYKFKTIRALYPFLQEVQRDNTTANGGVYASNELFNVPVTTDLYKENHVSSIYDPTNTDHRFASIYHLANNSKLTIEPCVQIFDATFEVNSGSEIVFENDLTNQVNVNRYQLLYNGGEVTKRRDNFLFQAETENKSIINYEAGDAILAGDHVDPAKAAGEYILTSQSNSSFVANNYIDLESGFHAENGSVFTALIQPVSIPTCTPNPPLRRGLSEQAIATENKTIQPAINLVSTPNPFVSDCYFIFSIEEQSEVSLSLYNSNGAEIASISNHKILVKGKYNYHFTGENLSSGLYLAKLLVNSKQKIIKLIKE